MRIISTPPNTPLPPKGMIVPDWRERFLRSLAFPCIMLRTLSWSTEFIEILVILASLNPTGPVSNILLKTLVSGDGACVNSLHITPLFLVGNLITISATVLRVLCYRALGTYFTFELRIQEPYHKLITHGPYSVVRHPSYTAMILSIMGALLSHIQPGSWIMQCSGFTQSTTGRVLAGFWVLTACAVILSLFLRLEREDAMMKGAFGKSWDRWSSQVRWCLIPGVY
ncbi:hypothetical protein VKT23_017787 [Stygiomarasmius scandens]|uniref:Protein-S-isoprenylcysteine O-methyltransferase n=1 Tax=Marasmiellus scandens TaxID=2682957 RepID=A0ABR1IU90_9AGAR